MIRHVLLAHVLLASSAFGQARSPVVPAEDAAARAVSKGDGQWFLDFGRAAFGNLEIVPPPGAAPATVTVHLGEAASDETTVHRSPGGTVRYQRHDLVLTPGTVASPPLTWKPPGWLKSGYVLPPDGMGQVMPFRYAEIENGPAWLTPEHVRRRSWSVPFDDEAADFRCSSEELNAVWDLCKHSIKATSFLGLYVDGDRERKPYEADALINQLAHYCVDARYDTARLTHEYLLAHPTWPTEWRLQSVLIGWLDVLWSGSDTSLRTHYETLKGRAMISGRTEDGLFRGGVVDGLRDIVDWPAGERDAYDMDQPVKTVVTAFHFRALVLLEKMARHLDRPAEAEEFARLAAATRLAVNEHLWDEARGCYVDGCDPATGTVSEHASAHANFFPLALGLVPPERTARVAAYVKSRGMVCSVYGAQFLLDALYDAGEAEAALALMTSDGLRSWRNMSEEVGSTITLEAWDPSLKPNLDWNHAWGAAPANVIPRKLMGIEPLEPGFARFRVRPQLGGLTRARVRMPSPRGPISLAIRHSARRWQAALTVPPDSVAEVHLPPHDPETLNLSGGEPRRLPGVGGRQVIALPPGTHRINLVPRAIRGMVGVGTWATRAEFRDIRVY